MNPVGGGRDAWLDTDSDDELFIRGAGRLDRDRWRDPEQREILEGSGHELLCRCGTRVLYGRQIEDALDAHTRRIFV